MLVLTIFVHARLLAFAQVLLVTLASIFLSFPGKLFQDLGYRWAKDSLDLPCNAKFLGSMSMVLHDMPLQA